MGERKIPGGVGVGEARWDVKMREDGRALAREGGRQRLGNCGM